MSLQLKHADHAWQIPVWLLAIIILILALWLKAPFIDTYFDHTFTSDSEQMVEETRAFYFFLQDPGIYNLPLPLSDYPTYLSGARITSAITANILRELIQAGILNMTLSDADNTLFIAAMRINGWLFSSMAVVLVFLTMGLLTSNRWLSFFLATVYFMFNTQQMYVDVMRVDHFLLWSYCLLTYASVRLLLQPYKLTSYMLAGAATGLILATKLNAPIYLLGLIFVVAMLLYQRQWSAKKSLAGLVVLLIFIIFFFVKWFIYPSNIIPTVIGIINTGKDWVAFWSKTPYQFYSITQFFDGSSSLRIYLFLLLSFISFLVTLFSWLIARKKTAGLLVILGLFFTLYGINAPVVNRYGVFYPVIYVLTIAYATQYLANLFTRRIIVAGIYTATSVVILLTGSFYLQAYVRHTTFLAHQEIATQQVRVASANWMRENVAPGSRVMVYHPRVNNPPVFDLPMSFSEDWFDFKYLHNNQLQQQKPPSKKVLLREFNIVLLNEQYYQFHLDKLDEMTADDVGSEKPYNVILDSLSSILHHMWWHEVNFKKAAYSVMAPADSNVMLEQIMSFENDYVKKPLRSLRFTSLASILPPNCNQALWTAFYTGLALFPEVVFQSEYVSYYSRWVKIYTISKAPLRAPWPEIALTDIGTITLPVDSPLHFKITNTLHMDWPICQIQFFTDSSMQWQVGPNINGLVDRFIPPLQPEYNLTDLQYLPGKIKDSIASYGEAVIADFTFRKTETPTIYLVMLSQAFAKSIYFMHQNSWTFGEYLQTLKNGEMKTLLTKYVNYKSAGKADSLTVNSFVHVLGLNFSSSMDETDQAFYGLVYPQYLKPGCTYYWRMRLKFNDTELSTWSNTGTFYLKAN